MPFQCLPKRRPRLLFVSLEAVVGVAEWQGVVTISLLWVGIRTDLVYKKFNAFVLFLRRGEMGVRDILRAGEEGRELTCER